MSKRCSSVEVATFFSKFTEKFNFHWVISIIFRRFFEKMRFFEKSENMRNIAKKSPTCEKKRAKSAVEVQFQPFLVDFSHFFDFWSFFLIFFDFVDFCVIFQILLKICDFNDFLRFSRLRGISPVPPRGAHGELS